MKFPPTRGAVLLLLTGLALAQPDPRIESRARAVLASDPNNVEARANLGVVLFFQSEYAKAIPELRRALQLRPALPNIQALLGMAEKRTGQLAPARADLENAFAGLKEEKLRVQTGLELIELDFATSELDKAAVVVGVLRQLKPTDVDILYTAHRIYSELASETMLGISMVAPQSARMHQVMAQEMVRQGNTAGAIAHYREAARIDPRLPGLHFELAERLAESPTADDQAQVVAEYQSALAENPFDEKTECRIGEISFKQSDINGALGHFKRAIELQPNDADASFGVAKALIASGKSKEALSPLEKAVQLDPFNATMRYRLGSLYRELGRAADSKRELAEYQRLREVKDRLKGVYRDMRLEPSKKERPDLDAK